MQLRHDRRDVGGGNRSQLGTQERRIQLADVAAKRLHPGPVGRRAAGFPAAPDQDVGPALSGPADQLVGKTALADAGLARQEDQAAASAERVVEARDQVAQLRLPADECPRGRLTVIAETFRRLLFERGILAQDRSLEVTKRPARFEAELLAQNATRIAVCLERLRLATRAVKSQHELVAEPLAQWVLGDEALELADQLGRSTTSELRLQVSLDRNEAELFEACDLGLGEPLRPKVGERFSAPQRACPLPGDASLRGALRSRLPDEGLDLVDVVLAVGDLQQVSGCLRLESRRDEQSAQVRDMHLQRLRGGVGDVLFPKCVDQRVGRDDAVRVQQQHREQRPLLRAADVDRPPSVVQLERPQESKSHLPLPSTTTLRLVAGETTRPHPKPLQA